MHTLRTNLQAATLSSVGVACTDNAQDSHADLLWSHKVVRFVFLDEGGISQHEPFVVVAGVIVHGDEQLIPLEKELDRLIRKHIPPEQQPGFVFHAKDIWSGIGKIFGDRDKWTLDRRLLILRDLARIPRRLDIPIVHESYERKKLLEDHPNPQHIATAHEISVAAHAVTFASCILRIEQYMREFYPTEVAQIVAEDNDQARKMLKGCMKVLGIPKELRVSCRTTFYR
jgi:hypothetical protein